MSEPDRRTDVEKLLAEVEGSLAGRPPKQAEAPPAARRPAGGLAARVRTAATAGVVAAAVVWVLFLLLPFLGAASGAAGAFLGTFVAVLLLRRR